MNANNIYDRINKIVIEGLEKEGLSWFKPWKNGAENRPFNMYTKRFYSGFNIFLLNCIMKEKGYQHNQWLTFKQCSENNGKISKGEKATDVYFWQIGYFDNKLNKYVKPQDIKKINPMELHEGKERYRKTFNVKFYKVFNVAQCEGIEPIVSEEEKSSITFEPSELAEQVVQHYVEKENGFIIKNDEQSAYYHPKLDFVNMPRRETFRDSDSYYKTLFHELAHSTGHKKRLDRKSLTEISFFGGETYAKEELVAEISSMYLVGLIGLNPKDSDENSQAYIKGWCKHLKDKPQECVFAMQQATKAVDYIQG